VQQSRYDLPALDVLAAARPHPERRLDRRLSPRAVHGGLLREQGVRNSFTKALWHELRGSGVTATVSCPGATATEFAEVARNARSLLFRLGPLPLPPWPGRAIAR